MKSWIDRVAPSEKILLSNSAIVAPRHRIFYMANPKALCTSMKMALLDLEGLELLARTSMSGETRREMTVHDAAIYPLRTLPFLPRSLVHEVLTSADWYRFTLVRNPYARFFSAWKNKILFREPGFLAAAFEDHFATPGRIDLGETFRCFVHSVAARASVLLLEDGHFMPQSQTTFHEHLRYSKVFRTTEIEIASLESTLSSRVGRTVVVPRVNQGLSADWRSAYDQASLDVVRDLYAEDFARFGFEEDVPVTGGAANRLEASADLIAQVRARNARIAELSSVPLYQFVRAHALKRINPHLARVARRIIK